MTDAAIAQMIREVLAEELSKIRAGANPGGVQDHRSVREEIVSITSDADLNNFVRRVLDMARDDGKRRAIEQGNLIFRLRGTKAGGGSFAAQAPAAAGGDIARVDTGIVSERQVDRLPRETGRLRIGKTVRLTPLAKDRLRQLGITIERMEP